MLSGLFYLAGVILAGYAGYSGLEWFFIFITSFIMAVGYFIARAPQIHGFVVEDGFLAIPKLALIQIMLYAIVTAPVYFIARMLS
jgi:hypothetical protein